MALPWAGDLFQKLQEMQRNSRTFNELFGLRTEVCQGTLGILQETWNQVKKYIFADTV